MATAMSLLSEETGARLEIDGDVGLVRSIAGPHVTVDRGSHRRCSGSWKKERRLSASASVAV